MVCSGCVGGQAQLLVEPGGGTGHTARVVGLGWQAQLPVKPGGYWPRSSCPHALPYS